MHAKTDRSAPEIHFFEDDGWIPNNPRLPLVVFRGAFDLMGNPDPEALIEATFARHGWGEFWRNNGIHPYTHYHSRIHEAMGIARGRTKVLFGGESGRVVDLHPSDVVVLPAGTGHQGVWKSPDLVVIGCYPPLGRYDLCRGSRAEHTRALAVIPHVPLPATDPVGGKNGPLIRLWRSEHLHSATA